MGRARGQRRKRELLIAVAVLAAGIGVLAYGTHLLRRSELQTIDARFSVRGYSGAPSDIVFVAIDPATFQELHPTSFRANGMHRSSTISAKPAHGRSPSTWNSIIRRTARTMKRYIEAVARAHGKTVFAASEVSSSGETNVLFGPQAQHEAGTRIGEDHFVLGQRRFCKTLRA